ncbi:MBL fold metallo-hydrolase [Sphingomonas sp. QA11]|uniref:ComEC/Rec2 family competence protein n=1 Tax=Sphingomonas sp. QA11 TaxID=2950605 RepID=UPI00234B9656|nr:MBL fold metallo-hydrolase [Sphingomonas sp. QA11]WCM28929.1 MBL fold metallo-hydrolase [Sphingomonas sp. QA11]
MPATIARYGRNPVLGLGAMLSVGLLAIPATVAVAAQPAKPLRVVSIDMEGGGGTLLVTPQGQSVLLDAGWPAGVRGTPLAQSSANRILAATRALGVTRIDYLIVTHYHLDHLGGIQDLLAVMPVGEIIDHGPNREMPPAGAVAGPDAIASLYARYEALLGGRKHRSAKAGDRITIGPLTLDIVSADRDLLPRILEGAGGSTPGCDAPRLPDMGNGGEENPRSIGVVASYGKARIVSLADLTADVEIGLVCRINRLGRADLLVVSHHGSQLSTTPPLLAALQPRVALMANGATKGGDARVFRTIAAAPSHPAIWQLHHATRSPEVNRPVDFIANPEGREDGGFWLDVSVWPDRRMKVTNARTGFSGDYPARR